MGIQVLDECRRRLADAADVLAEFRAAGADAPVVVLAEARAAAELVDRAVFAVDRARACQRRIIVREVAEARLERGGDRFLLSDGQARVVAGALGACVPAVRRLATTGEIRPGDVAAIRAEIDRAVDRVAGGGEALWEFGALRALEIYVQHHRPRPPRLDWAAALSRRCGTR